MLLDEYLDYFATIKNSSFNNTKCLYLKNWHFVKQFPHYNTYEVPIYFQSDYLNEYWSHLDDDYKFVYFGPKNSWFVSTFIFFK
ncbi:jmjC domain-containing protein 4-like isoform X4 [Dinothrombium tinctorium]|uniref:JmjC domain-containing protein 4-like isoform X4 n=1 Tax=Dinothrombium tinctorium TaxID=1965070 RepID=A0A443R769_9ACAR|nr:jmjC domain-containing protein 4-like isoform X4 [Dinothrombium tinctorium]